MTHSLLLALRRLGGLAVVLLVACTQPPAGIPSIPIPIPLTLTAANGTLTITAMPGAVDPGRRVEFYNFNLGVGVIKNVEQDGSFVVELPGQFAHATADGGSAGGDFIQYTQADQDGNNPTGGNCFEAKPTIAGPDDYFACPGVDGGI
jgi:hypothetical protein